MHDPGFVQRFDAEPQFWQFLKGLRPDDLIVELIQNDLDANASRTSITFASDRLICQGDGEPVSEDGWRRLSFVMGAGVEVESKQFRIGVKNHGLKACFWLGDEIIVRSDGLRMIQTLSRIHRMRASGYRPEAARRCSSESGMMILKTNPTLDNEHSIATVLKVNRNERRLAGSYRTKGSHV